METQIPPPPRALPPFNFQTDRRMRGQKFSSLKPSRKKFELTLYFRQNSFEEVGPLIYRVFCFLIPISKGFCLNRYVEKLKKSCYPKNYNNCPIIISPLIKTKEKKVLQKNIFFEKSLFFAFYSKSNVFGQFFFFRFSE